MAALAAKTSDLTAKAMAVPMAIGESAGKAVKSAMEAGKEVMSTGVQLGKDAAGVAVDSAQDVTQNAVDLVSDAAHAAGEAVEAGKSNLAKQIKRNPVSATIAALGVGFVAGVAGRK
jgi:hypothetical protein